MVGYIKLALRRRCNIFEAGQNLTDRRLAEVNTFDCVNDFSVAVEENDI